MPMFNGIVTAIVTPFDTDGNVDYDALRRLARFLGNHVQGLFVCGTYGSGPLMRIEERKRVAEVCIEEARNRLPVMVHVGSADTATVAELARHAEHTGADGVAAVLPYNYEHSEAAVVEHYRQLCRSVSIPVFAYNYPKASPTKLSPNLLAKLVDVGVTGLKDSANDLLSFASLMQRVDGARFEYVIGTECLLLPAMLMGCTAAMSGMAVAFPELVVSLYRAMAEGEAERAKAIQEQVFKLRSILHTWPHIPTIQAALRLRGLDAGVPRRPFLALSEMESAELKSRLEAVGFLKEVSI